MPAIRSGQEPSSSRAGHGSVALTDGIRVSVRPQYLAGQSRPDDGKFVFAYHISVRNEGPIAARLLRRHWRIVDADGEAREVDGDGVVGHTPLIAPGGQFEYASYCPLPTPWGTMEGYFEMKREDGAAFNASVGRFYLVAETGAGSV